MNTTITTTILTAEQQEVFNRYIETDGDYHKLKTGNINFHAAFFNFEVVKENENVLEIKSNKTHISMWKRVDHLIITIL